MDFETMTNEKLKEIYERGYNHHSVQSSFPTNEESKAIVDFMPSWEGLEVLELGCGSGRLCNLIGCMDAKSVYGVDYSESAIETAKKTAIPNVSFSTKDLHHVEGDFDVIVMQGVMEHLDNPYDELTEIINRNLRPDGTVITSSPSFLNPRGIVWMTLYHMVRVHMAMVDLHFIFPWDMDAWAVKNNYEIKVKSCDQDWGSGQKLLRDFNKRLRLDIFKEALTTQPDPDGLLNFLALASRYFPPNNYSGANLVYKIRRKDKK